MTANEFAPLATPVETTPKVSFADAITKRTEACVVGMGLTTHHQAFGEELEEAAVDSVVTAAPAPLAAARTLLAVLLVELDRLREAVATARLSEQAALEALRDAERQRGTIPGGPGTGGIAALLTVSLLVVVLLSGGVAAFLGHAFASQDIGVGLGRELGVSPSTMGFTVAFLLALSVTGSPMLLSALPGLVRRPLVASVVLIVCHVAFSVALALIRGRGEIGVLLGAYAVVEVVLGAIGVVWGWKLGPIMERFYERRELLAASDAKIAAAQVEYATTKAERLETEAIWRRELAAVTAREEAEDALKRNCAQARRAARIAYVTGLAKLVSEADAAPQGALTRE